jgi:predicted CXXCH cytochrome family protein
MKSTMNLTKKTNVIKTIFIFVSGACMFLSASPAAGIAYADTNGTCLFSIQLQSSPMREQFIASVANEGGTLLAYNTITDNEVQSDGSDDLSIRELFFGKNRSSFNQEDRIDSLSKNCMSCHDGFITAAVTVDYRNTPGHRTNKYDGKAEHPVGMNYASYAAMDPTNYKSLQAFNSKMIFVNGRVGCLTCHNPLNPEKSHLVMSDVKSALCLTCHKK